MNTETGNTLDRIKLDSSEVAFCIKKSEDSPTIGIYIPTLMSEIEMSNSAYEKTVSISSNMVENKDKNVIFESITLANYYTVEPYDPALYYVETNIGEQVRIKFLENDIKKCYYYDDTYKMTDALMEKIEEMQEDFDKLTETVESLKSEIKSLNGTIEDLNGSFKSEMSRLEGLINYDRK